jgi:hypothetical protein
MQNLKHKLEPRTAFLTSLPEILSEPYSAIFCDATLVYIQVQRRDFLELLKDYHCAHEVFVYESPKSFMRMTFKVGLMGEEEAAKALEMIDLRLKSENSSQEEVAEEIYRQVGDYWKLMDEVCRRVIEKVESDIWGKK